MHAHSTGAETDFTRLYGVFTPYCGIQSFLAWAGSRLLFHREYQGLEVANLNPRLEFACMQEELARDSSLGYVAGLDLISSYRG